MEGKEHDGRVQGWMGGLMDGAAAASIGLDKREGVPLRHALIPVGFTLFVRPFPQCTLPAQGGCIGEQGGQTTYSLQE